MVMVLVKVFPAESVTRTWTLWLVAASKSRRPPLATTRFEPESAKRPPALSSSV